jgi:hypothetical protein
MPAAEAPATLEPLAPHTRDHPAALTHAVDQDWTGKYNDRSLLTVKRAGKSGYRASHLIP